jgi:hypothetical protein
LAFCCLALIGCGSSSDSSAPVANPPGRTADPTKDIGHPTGKKLVPIGGMQQNPNAKPDMTPGSKMKTGG